LSYRPGYARRRIYRQSLAWVQCHRGVMMPP
jgi:hypothetical protein